MRDCVNAEVRDRLPELVHGRLEAGEQARVEAHVSECPDCAAEAALIRLAAGTAAASVPRMDAVRIAAALPATPLTVATPRRSVFGASTLRWAAGLAIAAAGVGAVQFFGSGESNSVRSLPATAERAVTRPVGGGTTHVGSYASAERRAGLVLVGGIDALSLDELEALVSGVESLSLLPAAEPDGISFGAGEEFR